VRPKKSKKASPKVKDLAARTVKVDQVKGGAVRLARRSMASGLKAGASEVLMES
jgi:hypothetical protein